jgi:hypothetical protein
LKLEVLSHALSGGKEYEVVVIGSPNVNSGFSLVNKKDYPEIAADFASMPRTRPFPGEPL